MAEHKVRLYTDFKYRAASAERAMVPVVLAQVDQVNDEERIKKHHARATHFELVSEIQQSDLCVLPDIWPSYVKGKKVFMAREFAEIASHHGKLTLVWSGGDPEWIIPIKSAIQIQEGLHKNVTRRVAFAFERPGFVNDYVKQYQNDSWQPIPKMSKPTVGFCGLAAGKLHSRIMFIFRNTLVKLRYSMGISAVLPTFGGYPGKLRAKTLNLLHKHAGIEANFIIRDRYKAGVPSGVTLTKEIPRLEFIENILGNTYTVCVKGGGNYSKRFYETLCCGRIPILVDTDTILPYEEFVDWNEHIVRVKKGDLLRIGDVVCEHHSRLSDSDLQEIQRNNRRLWVEQLSAPGYYASFHRYISFITDVDK